MTGSKQIAERRRQHRFRAPEGLFGILGARHLTLGRIVDINTIGLTFRYIGRKKLSTGMHTMDIYMSQVYFHLSRISVVTISDVEVIHGRPYWPITIRRCGMEFGGLTAQEKARLQGFIEKRHG
jgi:hypothetical protein